MNKILCTVATMVALTSAQGSGHGISKFTRGQAEPVACLTFFEDIMGGSVATDECTNNECECATQGRAQVCETAVSAE
jgi:hypothetical protein